MWKQKNYTHLELFGILHLVMLSSRFSYFFVAMMLFVLLGGTVVFAQTYQPAQSVDEVQEAIEDVNARIRRIESEIAQFRDEANKVSAEKQTLQNKLQQIELERKKLLSSVDLAQEQISATQLSLGEIREGMSETEKAIEIHRNTIAKAFRRLNELDNFSTIEMALSDYRLSEIFQERDEIRVLQNTLGERILDLRFLRADLNDRRKEFLTEQEQLEELQKEILDRKKIVEDNKSQQSVLLRETQYEETRYQNLIAEREALRKAFEQELYAYESKLVFLLDPTLLPARGSGILSWPLDSILVTQMFGAKTGPHRTYANGHSGVDFRANGDPVYAMADGVVQGVGDTDIACRAASFGKWVLLDFDNNLAATYGHLSIISVTKGQRVKRGQLIGYSGNTGRSTAPHLHVSLYAGIDANGKSPVEVQGKESLACKGKILVQPRAPIDAYLDLLDYLPPLTDNNFKAGVRR